MLVPQRMFSLCSCAVMVCKACAKMSFSSASANSCPWIVFSCLMRVSSDFMMPSWFVIMLPVVALLLAQVRKVVEARPVTWPLALAPIVGLRFGFLLDGRFRRERAASLLMLAGVFVGLRLRVEVVGDVHDVRI